MKIAGKHLNRLFYFILYWFIDSTLNCCGLETQLRRFLHNIIRKCGFLPVEKLPSEPLPLLNGMTSASEKTHTHTHDYSLVDSFTINFLLKAQAHCQCVIYALSTLTHL